MTTEVENPSRLKDFKNKGLDVEDLQTLLSLHYSVEIRKANKDDHLFDRRKSIDIDDEPLGPLQEPNQQAAANMTVEDIVNGINSGDNNKEITATRAARIILSGRKSPPIDIFINAGVVPKLVRFLNRTANPDLQFESAYILTNIAAGTSAQTKAVVNAGAVAGFILLLGSPHTVVVEQAVWALGNIAGDSSKLRDHVIQAGIIKPILDLIKPDRSVTSLQKVAWTLCNLCRDKNPPPDVAAVRQLFPALAYFICHSDKEILAIACTTLAYLTDGPNKRIQELLDANVVPRLVPSLVRLLDRSEVSIITPTLRVIGNIVAGTAVQTDSVLAAGCCPLLAKLLEHSQRSIVKEAAWTVSNIAAGNAIQIQALISNNVIRPLIDVLAKGHFTCQKEAAWTIANISKGGNAEQISLLCPLGALQPMCALLEAKDPITILVILDSVTNILAAAEKKKELEKVFLQIEECGGLDRIKNLKSHDDIDIRNKSLAILEQYFSFYTVRLRAMRIRSTSQAGVTTK